MKNPIRTALITCAATFILGYLNGHTQSTINSFVSPQTGNLIHLGLHVANQDAPRIITSLIMFFSFVLGCAAAHAILQRKYRPRIEFLLSWSFFVLPIAAYVFFGALLTANTVIFTLSLASGAALGFFRKIGDIELNNNIVTGNMRFLAINLYDGTAGRNPARLRPFWIYALAIFLFFLGSFVCGVALNIHPNLANWLLIALLALPYAVGASAPLSRRFE